MCEDSEGAVSLDDAAHHADLLGPEELQRQRLAGQQHHGRVGQHRDGLAAVLVVDRPAVELLHVCTQVLSPTCDETRILSSHQTNGNHLIKGESRVSKKIYKLYLCVIKTESATVEYYSGGVSSPTEWEVGRLGSKLMSGFSAFSLSRSSDSMSFSSSSFSG